MVVFQILFAAVVAGGLGGGKGIERFLLAVVGGAALGFGVGYTGSKITQTIDDPQIEITLTTIIAYGSYLLTNHLHLSGVIATASAGLMVGNFGAKKGMSAQTRTALESFWEYIAFVMNSLVFLLIGLEVHVDSLAHAWRPDDLLFSLDAGAVFRGTRSCHCPSGGASGGSVADRHRTGRAKLAGKLPDFAPRHPLLDVALTG